MISNELMGALTDGFFLIVAFCGIATNYLRPSVPADNWPITLLTFFICILLIVTFCLSGAALVNIGMPTAILLISLIVLRLQGFRG
jgi:hypothetical protein